MEKNIELFDSYISGTLCADEKKSFEARLKTDADFATDFKVYLLTVRGLCLEAEQDNLEFGHAMKKLSKEELLKVIGRSEKPRKAFRVSRLLRERVVRERLAWAASIAIVLAVGGTAVFNTQRMAEYEADNLISAYNAVPYSDRARGAEFDITSCDSEELKDMLPELQRQYADAPADDIQAQQDAGMRLAMAYLKLHDREMTRKTLEELKVRFADDEIFVAQCDRILSEIK